MIKVTELLLTFISLFCLTACSNQNENVIIAENSFKMAPHRFFTLTALKLSSPIGEWKYAFPFYTSELIINQDHTFRFHEQGCMGHGYSEGKWTSSGNNLMLVSDAKYKLDSRLKIVEIKSNCQPPKRVKKKRPKMPVLELDSSLYNSTAAYNFSPSDTFNVYFYKAQFSLEGDTLYRLDENSLKTEAKFTLRKNNR